MKNYPSTFFILGLFFFCSFGCTKKRLSGKGSTTDLDVIIVKRLPSDNKNLTHNKYPKCTKGWENHVRENIVFPETSNIDYTIGYVPLLFRVKPDSTIYDIAINEAPRRKWSGTLITDPDFQKESLRLLMSSGKWSPTLNQGDYVNREATAIVHFYYHKEYFDQATEALVLNPDAKAKFVGEQRIYEKLVNNKFGCDGVVEIIFIVEKDGTISNVECLNAMGKTNCSVGLNEFARLIPWKAAMKNGKKVRTQMKFSIHT